MRKRKINYNFTLGLIFTLGIAVLVVVGFFWTPYSPEAMDGSVKFAGSSLLHPMGCDNFGRDILSRVMVGAGTTLLVAVGTVFIGTAAGVLIGAFTGYFGGVLDEVMMRIVDALFAFPSILLALVVIAVTGEGTYHVIYALGIAFVPSFARIVRGEFLRCRELEYVRLARLSGAGHLRIMFVHILPNIRPVLVSAVLIGFNNAVLAEAGLSYLGIGVQPPYASLGRMLSEAQTYIFTNPAGCMWPGLILILMILGFSLLADGVKKGNE
ncbi:MAG: ABC transporter permease [Roseburia sp.]